MVRLDNKVPLELQVLPAKGDAPVVMALLDHKDSWERLELKGLEDTLAVTAHLDAREMVEPLVDKVTLEIREKGVLLENQVLQEKLVQGDLQAQLEILEQREKLESREIEVKMADQEFLENRGHLDFQVPLVWVDRKEGRVNLEKMECRDLKGKQV